MFTWNESRSPDPSTSRSTVFHVERVDRWRLAAGVVCHSRSSLAPVCALSCGSAGVKTSRSVGRCERGVVLAAPACEPNSACVGHGRCACRNRFGGDDRQGERARVATQSFARLARVSERVTAPPQNLWLTRGQCVGCGCWKDHRLLQCGLRSCGVGPTTRHRRFGLGRVGPARWGACSVLLFPLTQATARNDLHAWSKNKTS